MLNSSNELTPDPAWGMAANCGQNVGSFGGRMPMTFGPGMMWSDAPKIRDWICAGAPGP
jgi:hypothetical protein